MNECFFIFIHRLQEQKSCFHNYFQLWILGGSETANTNAHDKLTDDDQAVLTPDDIGTEENYSDGLADSEYGDAADTVQSRKEHLDDGDYVIQVWFLNPNSVPFSEKSQCHGRVLLGGTVVVSSLSLRVHARGMQQILVHLCLRGQSSVLSR